MSDVDAPEHLQEPERGERSDGKLGQNRHHHQRPVWCLGPDAIDVRFPRIGRKVARQSDASSGNAIVGGGEPRRIRAGIVPLPLFDIYDLDPIASSGQAYTQAGSRPSAKRPWHISHLPTTPRSGLYCGTP